MNSKQKGKRGELEFSNKCKEFGFDTKRSVQYCGANGDSDVIGLPHIHAEVKRVEKLNIEKAVEQAVDDCLKGHYPIVAHRKNKKKWLVTMEFDDWMELYKGWLIARD